MQQRRSPTRILGGALFVAVVFPVLIGAGVAIGARGSDDGTAVMTTTTSITSPTVAGPAPTQDAPATSEPTPRLLTMVDQHQAMMDQMRVNATPQMLDLMNNDPMWQMMRSGDYVKLLEGHEAEIDQMLGRAG